MIQGGAQKAKEDRVTIIYGQLIDKKNKSICKTATISSHFEKKNLSFVRFKF